MKAILCALLLGSLAGIPALAQEPPADPIERQIRAQAPKEETDTAMPQTEAPDGTRVFTDEVVVGEAEILVQLPDALLYRPPIDLESLVLTVDGVPRRIVRADPLGVGEGEVLVVVDRDHGRDETLAKGAVALARRAGELLRLGPVTVLEMESGTPRVLAEAVASTRNTRQLEVALADVASRLRREGEWMAGAPVSPHPPESLWDPLTDAVVATGGGGPRFVFLVSDGFFPTADEMEVWNRGGGLEALTGGPPGAAPRGVAVRRAALRLAAAGWVVIPVTLAPEKLQKKVKDPFEIHYPGGESQVFLDFGRMYDFLRGRGARYGRRVVDARSLEAAWLPELAPLQELASVTGGLVVRYEDMLPAALEALGDRRRLWFETPPLPTDRPVPVEIRWVDTGEKARARRWLAPSSPP